MSDHLYVGIDTHKNSHTAAVLESYFDLIFSITFENSYDGFLKFLDELKKQAKDKIFVFALEDSQGVGSSLSEFLTTKGFLVLDVNPVLTYRDRKHTTHKNKSDIEDAIAIAKTLIRERKNLPKVEINKNSLALKELIKYRQNLVDESTRIKNRLHVIIFNQYGKICSVFSNLFTKVSLSFFLKYPGPFNLKNTNPEELAEFLKINSHNNYGKSKAAVILSQVKNNSKDDCLAKIRACLIRKNIIRLCAIQNELEEIKDMLYTLLDKSSYMCLTSIPGIDIIAAAKIISQIIDIGRFSSSSKLAKFVGVAPVEKSSGKKSRYQKSKYGKRYLNSVFYYIALSHISRTKNGIDKNPISRAYYLKKIAEGKTKKEAITCLQRRLCDVIFAVMRDKAEYDFLKIKSIEKSCDILETSIA